MRLSLRHFVPALVGALVVGLVLQRALRDGGTPVVVRSNVPGETAGDPSAASAAPAVPAAKAVAEPADLDTSLVAQATGGSVEV